MLTQRSSNDMVAYARWSSGTLVRSISLNPVGRVWESIGPPAPFEAPFWAGRHPVGGDYSLPFHPLEFGDAALLAEFGIRGEAPPGDGGVAIDDVTLFRWRRESRPTGER